MKSFWKVISMKTSPNLILADNQNVTLRIGIDKIRKFWREDACPSLVKGKLRIQCKVWTFTAVILQKYWSNKRPKKKCKRKYGKYKIQEEINVEWKEKKITEERKKQKM